MEITWRRMGDAVATRYARSSWRLPVALVTTVVAIFLPLYLVRGMRLVRLAVLGAVGLGAVSLGFERPFQTLALAIFCAFSGLSAYLPVGSVVAALLLLVAARVAWDRLDGARLDLGPFALRLTLAILLTCALGSMLMAQSWRAAGEQARLIVIGGLIFTLLSHLAPRSGRLIAILIAVSAGMCVGTLVVIRGLFAASSLGLLRIISEARFGGLGGDPNVQAAIANTMLAPMVHVLGRARGWWRLPLLLVLLSLIATVILSQSRAGMGLMGLILVVLLLRERRARPVAFTAAAALGIAAFFLPRVYWVRFVSIGQLSGIVVDRSLQLRQHILEGGWQMFLDHPIFGVGFGNFGVNAGHFMLGNWVAHNSYLELAASIGILGALSYVFMVAMGVRMAWKARAVWRRAGLPADAALAESLAIGVVAFAAMALTLSIPFYAVFWVLLGLTNAARLAALAAAESAPHSNGSRRVDPSLSA